MKLDNVQHYLKMVDGLFALRAVAPLSAETEAELAEVHDQLWRSMTEDEQQQAEDGIEKIKTLWKDRQRDEPA